MTSQMEPWVGLELKYCEQCGGLWLRRQGSQECYCAGCARFLEDIPARMPDNRRQGGSGPLRRKLRKQQREPGMELVPLEYVMTAMQGVETEEGEGAQLEAESAEPAWGQEGAYERV